MKYFFIFLAFVVILNTLYSYNAGLGIVTGLFVLVYALINSFN